MQLLALVDKPEVNIELPFLKNKRKNMGGGGGVTEVAHTSDSTDNSALMEHIADELLDAISRKDIRGIRSALAALVQMIQEADQQLDEENQ